MKITAAQNQNQRKIADYLIIPFIEEKKKPKPLCAIGKFSNIIKGPIQSKDFEGKESQISVVYGAKEKRVILLGLGKPDKIDEFHISLIYSEVVAFLKKRKAKTVNIIVPEKLNISKEDLLKGIAEALFLTNYGFDKFKHSTKNEVASYLKSACLIGVEKKELALVHKGKIIADGVNLTRDLVNNNADDETPQNLAKIAKSFEKISKKVKVIIFDKKKIEQEKMGLLLAVNKGSDKDPAFIIVHYHGDLDSEDHSVIIGKGITYDSGGLSLKPSTGMDTMKSDMSGGAAILGTMYTIANLNLKVNVTALVPATENSIGSKSYKPGDVYVGLGNKSVEVKNTDAEGRLILADALSYAVEKLKPNRIIDIASLTGACVVALGEDVAGLFSNNEKLAKDLIAASNKTGDHLWRLPLYKDYKKQLKSDIADLKNIGNAREAGAITAALFLEEFVEKVDWAHIDIGGPCFLSKPKGLHPTHATGVGVRLLTYFFENLSIKPA
ncbi:MAG: Cytosol aminopeptidase [Candidatus Anoxychlamydiales bacterium]|nr:Cytosol aminopeptidase [Candidatus Anoxychlamydiales bacterium]